eukprot:15473015-Alexandrium_andersonii.AAC.1
MMAQRSPSGILAQSSSLHNNGTIPSWIGSFCLRAFSRRTRLLAAAESMPTLIGWGMRHAARRPSASALAEVATLPIRATRLALDIAEPREKLHSSSNSGVSMSASSGKMTDAPPKRRSGTLGHLTEPSV